MRHSADWNRIETALDALLLLEPSSRSAALARLTGGDAGMRSELESLLPFLDGGDELLDVSALDAMGVDELPGSLRRGHVVGSYRVVCLIGRGGMGEVYKAERAIGDFHQVVALKMMRVDTLGSIERFHAERQILAELEHPGIARLLDGGVTDDGRPYMIMEYVEGKDIVSHCTERRDSLEQRLRLFLQVCDAVAYAHSHLIVHRDLKPSNIFVTGEGRVKLLDFGVAKLMQGGATEDPTRTAQLSFAYAAPEQLTGSQVTTATDSYALGVTLYQLLCGVLPWRASDVPIASVMQRLLEETPPAPSRVVAPESGINARHLRGDLDAIIAKALRKQSHQRYVNARALAGDIVRHLAHEPVRARQGARTYVMRRFARRHWLPLSAITALLIATAVGVAGVLWQASIARQQAERATATKDFLISVFKASDPRIAQDKPRGQVTAKELLDSSADRISQDFATDPATELELLGITSDIYDALDERPRAIALRQQRTQLARKLYGDRNSVVIEGLLAETADLVNDQLYDKASELLAQSDQVIKHLQLEHSALRARWWNLKGDTLWASNDARELRIAAFRRSVELYSQVAPRDPDYSNVLNSLAVEYSQNGQRELARDAYQRAVGVAQTASPRDDSTVAGEEINLAVTLQAMGDLQGAVKNYEDAAALSLRTYGKDNGLYWAARSNEAYLLDRCGERESAERIFSELMPRVPVDWKSSSDIADDAYAQEYYGASLASEGRAAEGIPWMERAEQAFRERPMDEYDLPRIHRRLGDAYDLAGRTTEARRMLKAAYDERIAHSAPELESTIDVHERWGRFLFDHGDSAGAEAEFRDVLARSAGRPLSFVPLAHMGLARIALAKGQIDAALTESKAAVDSIDRIVGLCDIRVGPRIWLVRSAVLLAHGDIPGAREWAQRALDADRRYDDPSSPEITQALRALKAAE